MPEISAAVRALRVRVLEDMAFAANGDRDSRLNEQMKAAVQAELGHAGLTVLHGRDERPDLDVRLELRVTAGVYLVHGHVTLTAESEDTAVAIAVTPDEFHRAGQFPLIAAEKGVQALLHSPGLAEFADKKNPRLAAGRNEQHPASTETKPSPETLASAKEHFNQGNRHYELGHYQDALGEFETAYMAVPDPVFLFNIAQCHRKMGHDKEAASFYKSYLRNAPNAPNRAEVQKRIQELEGGKPH
jgi:tetratricopeptide (TPR) repeat protein